MDALTVSNVNLSIYEQLAEINQSILACAETARHKTTAAELAIISTKLEAVLLLFDETQLVPVIATQLGVKRRQNSIERLGLSKEIIRLSTQCEYTPVQIYNHLQEMGIDVSQEVIARYLRNYSGASTAEKIRRRNLSVFETSQQLERLLTIINTQLGRLSNTIDPLQQGNHRGYVGELRQVIKLASDLQTQVYEQLKQAQFQQAVKEILLSVCNSEQRNIILEKLKNFGETSSEIQPIYGSAIGH